jgi:hypothetical protein
VGQGHDRHARQADRDDELAALRDVEPEEGVVAERDPRDLRDEPGLQEEPPAGGKGERQRDDRQGQPPDPEGRQADGQAGDHRPAHAEDHGERQRNGEVGVGSGGDEGADPHEGHLGQRDLAGPVHQDVEAGHRHDGDGDLHHDRVGELGQRPGAEERNGQRQRQPEAPKPP